MKTPKQKKFVVKSDGMPTQLVVKDLSVWKKIPIGGVLLGVVRGRTRFGSRQEAEQAIKRTKKYLVSDAQGELRKWHEQNPIEYTIEEE